MVLTSKLMRYALMGRRSLYSTPMRCDSKSILRLKQLQSDYQCEDGRPIWLKAGLRDRILYSATIVGCIVGLAGVFSTIYQLAKPAAWSTPSEC